MIWLSLAFIAVGLLMIVGSNWVAQALLKLIVLWVGVGILVVGLILLLTPVIVWVDHQLRSAFGS